MNIVKKIVPESKYNIKCPYTMKPTRIVVHNTANDASARNEISYMTNNNYETSFHYAVDDKEIVQGIEENRNAWHSGDGNGKGNREGIGIEICYSKSGGDRFIKAEQNAVELIVDILKRYNWGIDKVTKHQDYSNKYCPHRTLDMGWNRFIKMIEDKLNVSNSKETTTSSKFKKGDKVVLNGYLYVDSKGNGRGQYKKNYKGTITIVANGSKPYHIDSLGWVAENDIKLQTTANKTTYKIVSNCTWLNLRTSASYGNNIYKAVKSGTKVEYLGLSNGWAKIKYEGKTLYCGSGYLK